MRTSTLILFLAVSLLGLVAVSVGGCGTAEYYMPDMAGVGGGGGDAGGGGGGGQDGSPPAGDMATSAPVTVVGTWLSSGANLAKGLASAPINAMSITGVFKADQTYAVSATDTSGKTTTSSGTWTSVASSVPGIFNLTQMQTQPSAATAQGIYKIDDTVSPPMLTLEGIQTSPSLGASPPTAQGGFGSTVVNGQKTSDWVQKYVRQ